MLGTRIIISLVAAYGDDINIGKELELAFLADNYHRST